MTKKEALIQLIIYLKMLRNRSLEIMEESSQPLSKEREETLSQELSIIHMCLQHLIEVEKKIRGM